MDIEIKLQRIALQAGDRMKRGDIAHAFQVRRRMRELGFGFRLSDADGGRSAASFFHNDAEQGLAGAAVADTDAEAICKAALEAVTDKAKAASG